MGLARSAAPILYNPDLSGGGSNSSSMRIGTLLGSWPCIAAVPIACLAAQQLGVNESLITYVLSVSALTLSQLIIREQNNDSKIDKAIQDEQLDLERQIAEKV